MPFVGQSVSACRKSLRNVRSKLARLQQRRYAVCCLREPMELARRIFRFLSGGKTRLVEVGGDCGVLSNGRWTAVLEPHVGSEFETAATGCCPITPGKDIRLDADWLAVFHRVPPLVTFSPVLLTLLIPDRNGAALLIKHNPRRNSQM